MATLRQKESMIPLKVDSRLKNISKIPLRTDTKPKSLSSTETTLKKSSITVKNKSSVKPLVRNKKSYEEIPKKEQKPVQQKNKENRCSVKISQNRLHEVRRPKTIAPDKEIKSLNPVPGVPKHRKEMTVKEVIEKQEPVKKRNDPINLFKKVPAINTLDDDPFKITAEEKQVKRLNHPSQQNIEFVPDERMRNLILNNKELTPSILKSCSTIKTSSVMERPSLYKKHNFSVDPYKQALADIANYDLASEGRRVSEMQRNRICTSPLQNRNSLYKPFKCVGDPYQEALKSLAQLRMNRKEKSCKKVTFKLSCEDQSSKNETRNENNAEKSIEVIQAKSSDQSKQSPRSYTNPTFEFKKNTLLTPGSNLLKTISNDSSKSNEIFVNKEIGNTCIFKKTDEKESDFFNHNTNTPTSAPLKIVTNNENGFSPILHQKQNCGKYTAIFGHGITNSILKTVHPFLNSYGTSEVRHSLFSKESGLVSEKTNPKLFTPQPVSFYPRTQLFENISPEFLTKRTTDILSCAPINTPMVLKTLGKLEQSPVCKKLEFKDSPKETNKKQDGSRENTQTFCLQNIMTQQKILDQLAHQECSIFMDEARFPCERRKYLQNPIAQILSEGDETHFIPVYAGRLS